jgi:tetratricopeptide (TPR) repeat protein
LHLLDGYRAVGLAMLGRVDEARAALVEGIAGVTDRGGGVALAFMNTHLATGVELLAGDPAAAVSFGEEGCMLFEKMGEKGYRSTAAALLAQSLCEAGRLDEALDWADRADELGASSDVLTRMLSMQARAKVLALHGAPADAELLSREAVAIAEQTDFLSGHGDALVNLAEVLELVGRAEEQIRALEQALALYERKGNLTMADRARRSLAEVGVPTPALDSVPKP